MAYKGFGPSIQTLDNWSEQDVASIPSLQAVPVQSAITNYKAGDTVEKGYTTIKGYAYSGGGKKIFRVDVSVDNGVTWHTAKLTDGGNQDSNRAWAWTLWELDIPDLGLQTSGTDDINNHTYSNTTSTTNANATIICKAIDESYNVQPDTITGIWTLRGLNNNAWHRVPITLIDPMDEDNTNE